MPIYEYECGKCGHRFENLQEVNDPAPCCPKCKGGVRKLMSAATPLTSKRGSPGQACRGMEEGCGVPQCPGGACGGGKCPGM